MTTLPTTSTALGNLHVTMHTNPLYVTSYGAVGDGVTDDTTAIQNAINACIGTGTASATTREAAARLHFPAGSYKVTSPISVASVHGLHISGDGPGKVKFLPAATLDSLFDLNGLTMTTLEGFSVHGTLQSGTKVDKVINLYWDSSTSANVSNMVTFRNVEIYDVTFTTAGFRTTKTSNSPEVDLVKFYDCMVRGGWAGSGTDSQNGFYFGSGTASNALGHFMYGCQVYRTRYAVQSQGVSFGWWGGQTAMGTGNAMDRVVYLSQSPKWVVLEGIRGESSKRFFSADGWTTVTDVSMRNIEFAADLLDADTRFIDVISAGHYRLENVMVTAADGATLRFSPSSASAYTKVSIDGLAIRGTNVGGSMFTIAGSGLVELEARGLQKLNSSLAVTDSLVGVYRASSTSSLTDRPTYTQWIRPSAAIAENFTRNGALFGNSSVLVSGRMHLVAIELFAGDVVTGIKFWTGATGLTRGSNADSHLWVALYKPDFTLAGQSTDDTSTAYGSNTVISKNLSSQYTVTSTGLHHAALMVNAGTGGSPAVPTLVGVTATQVALTHALAPIFNWADTVNTGLTATAPNPASTPTSAMVLGAAPYCNLI